MEHPVRRRHWENRGEGGDTCFLTTTVLDFAHLFARPEMRSLMAESIAYACHQTAAHLHAFVVMTHHIHLLLTLPDGMSLSAFAQRLKAGAYKLVFPRLNPDELAHLDQQSGLNKRRMWQRSFRGLVVSTREIFEQKVRYIHENPVRAGLVDSAEDYPWSSASLWNPQYVRDDFCFDCLALLERYRTSPTFSLSVPHSHPKSLNTTQGGSC